MISKEYKVFPQVMNKKTLLCIKEIKIQYDFHVIHRFYLRKLRRNSLLPNPNWDSHLA